MGGLWIFICCGAGRFWRSRVGTVFGVFVFNGLRGGGKDLLRFGPVLCGGVNPRGLELCFGAFKKMHGECLPFGFSNKRMVHNDDKFQ